MNSHKKRRIFSNSMFSCPTSGTAHKEFPEEVLITEILVRLPVKSIMRFRCVSKSLCSVIDSPYFINLHMDTSSKHSNHLKLIFVDSNLLISTNFNSANLRASDFGNNIQEELDYWEKGLYICGYCNGVFLLRFNSYRLALWNPSTQKRRVIPHCPPERSIGTIYGSRMGLGYDSTRDEYKVVLIVDETHKNTQEAFQVWIFGSRSNSWRRIKTGFFKQIVFHYVGKFAHGDLHWICILDNKNFDSRDIVAFDVANETFSLVTRPLYPAKEKYLNLHVLHGCLCISFVSYPQEEAILYVGKKDGADFTWSMLYSVTKAQLPPFLGIDSFINVTVLGNSKEGDKVMLDLGLRYIVLYDPKEKSFQKTTIVSRMSKIGSVQPCLESLVSVCDGELQETMGTAM